MAHSQGNTHVCRSCKRADALSSAPSDGALMAQWRSWARAHADRIGPILHKALLHPLDDPGDDMASPHASDSGCADEDDAGPKIRPWHPNQVWYHRS
jgi:hypothetical protein